MIFRLARSLADIIALDDITEKALVDLGTLANSPEFSIVPQQVATPNGTATKIILKDHTSGTERQEELLAYLPDGRGCPVEQAVIRKDYGLILSAVYERLAQLGFTRPSYRLDFPFLQDLPERDDIMGDSGRFTPPFIH
jgi:hypothetical protein